MSARMKVDTDRENTGYGWEIKCAFCGTWFDAKLDTATYCGSRCRTAGHRMSKSRVKRRDAIRKAIHDYARSMPSTGSSMEFETLVEIQMIISKALEFVTE